eukprot:CAMPEP_0119186100 /NCGR_PEP_ID=MMETSP1315-20130426/68848_1 /TAXON_ID=676789 /ORGANISM="Prasinoderma singularis, Strain RCC927" /LENGTH=527 /DNA_ID=CAMNT_0007180535 /DNA_START=69 /DNA_END=1652 /DNA_ORIENTATION=+
MCTTAAVEVDLGGVGVGAARSTLAALRAGSGGSCDALGAGQGSPRGGIAAARAEVVRGAREKRRGAATAIIRLLGGCALRAQFAALAGAAVALVFVVLVKITPRLPAVAFGDHPSGFGTALGHALVSMTRDAAEACPGALPAPAAAPESGFVVYTAVSFGSRGDDVTGNRAAAALGLWAAHYRAAGARSARDELRMMVHAASCEGVAAGARSAEAAGVRVWGGYVGPFSDDAQDHWQRVHAAAQLARGDWIIMSDVDELQELGCGGVRAHVDALRAGGREVALGALVDALAPGCDTGAPLLPYEVGGTASTQFPLLCTLAWHISNEPYMTKVTAFRYGGSLTYLSGHHVPGPVLSIDDTRLPPGAPPGSPVPFGQRRDDDYATLAGGALHGRLTLVRHVRWDATAEERMRLRGGQFRELGISWHQISWDQAEFLRALRSGKVPGGRAGTCARICADPRHRGGSVGGQHMLALEPMLQEYAAAVVKDGRLRDDRGPLQLAAVENFRELARAGFEHIEELGCEKYTVRS